MSISSQGVELIWSLYGKNAWKGLDGKSFLAMIYDQIQSSDHEYFWEAILASVT